MQVIKIKSNVRDYTVSFPDRPDFINNISPKSESLYVIDSNVWKHHRAGCLASLPESNVLVFPVSEERKNLESVEELYDHVMDRSAKKNMTMISIGGGILQDITGFAATTLYRGINWIFIPTTLLAQADSCIGSKTSLNYKRFKNLVGTFYPPSEVYIYAPFLKSLTDADFFSGLGEVVKLHIMGGEEKGLELIEMLPPIIDRQPGALMTAIQNSLSIKRSFMEGDEFDIGRRNLLNFGHCFGHAIESVSDYSIPHGQGVIIGMLFANIVAEKRNMMSSGTALILAEKLLLKTIKANILPSHLDSKRITEAMKKDKKRTGPGLVIVLMKEDFTFDKIIDFPEQDVAPAIDELRVILRMH